MRRGHGAVTVRVTVTPMRLRGQEGSTQLALSVSSRVNFPVKRHAGGAGWLWLAGIASVRKARMYRLLLVLPVRPVPPPRAHGHRGSTGGARNPSSCFILAGQAVGGLEVSLPPPCQLEWTSAEKPTRPQWPDLAAANLNWNGSTLGGPQRVADADLPVPSALCGLRLAATHSKHRPKQSL
jgi:hypothetical protein